MFQKKLSLTILLVSALMSSSVWAGPVENIAASWQKLLKKHVKISGAVDYQGFSKDEAALKAVIDQHAGIAAASLSDGAKKALYINLYNMVMVYHILKHAKAAKIAVGSDKFRKIQVNDIDTPGGNIWNGNYKVKLAGTMVNLDDIEHGLIRGQAGGVPKALEVKVLDPRIHAAVNCAAISCPPLLPTAYTPANINSLLEQNMKRWVSSSVQFRKKSDSKMRANSIVFWYYDDFDDFALARKMKGAGEYLSKFLLPKSKDRDWKQKHLNENFNDRSQISLKLSSAFDFYYNWKINDSRNYR